MERACNSLTDFVTSLLLLENLVVIQLLDTADSSPSSSTSLKTKPKIQIKKIKQSEKTTQELDPTSNDLNLENPHSKFGFNLVK